MTEETEFVIEEEPKNEEVEETEESFEIPSDPRDVLGNIIDVANDPDAQRKLAEAYGPKDEPVVGEPDPEDGPEDEDDSEGETD